MRVAVAVLVCIALAMGVVGFVQSGWADERAKRAEVDLEHLQADYVALEQEHAVLQTEAEDLTVNYIAVVDLLDKMLENDRAIVALLKRQGRTTDLTAAAARP